MKSIYAIHRLLKSIIMLILFNLIVMNFGWGQVSMTSGGTNTQNFSTLSDAGGTFINNSTIPSWYWQEVGEVLTYKGDDGSESPTITTRYAYRMKESPDKAMGGIPIGSNGIAMGIQLVNNSGGPIESIKVSYTGEQWHCGGSGTASKITFWYKISSSIITNLTPGNNTGWTAVTSLDFTSPVTSSLNQGQLNGNLAANRTVFTNISIPNISIPTGSYIMLRWSYPSQGAPHGLAIDDVSISWIGNTVSNRTGIWSSEIWSNGAPSSITSAIINSNVTVSSSPSCYNLTINSGKALTVNSGMTLNVLNNFLIKSTSASSELGVGSFLNNGTINIGGSASVELYVKGTTLHNGVYFSPPLNSITAPSVSDLVYRYNASQCTWVLVYNTLNVGTGYTVRSDNDITVNLHGGTLTNSNVYVGGLVRQSSPNNYGWNLVGNPFVCGLDWDILNNTASNYTNLTNGFYIRASDGATISWVNGVGNPSGTSSVIPPFQGFYAQVLLGQSTGNLNMPLNARTHNNRTLYKSDISLLRLKLTSSDGNSDETVFRIDDNTTEGFDNQYDANKMFADNDNLPQIFSLSSEKDELCINAISVNNNKILTIPIGFKSPADGEYTIKAFDFDNIDKSISFYLKDNQNNSLQDLRKNPVYVFNTNATFDNERFVIILGKQSSNINNEKPVSKVQINNSNKSIYINLQGETNANIEIYNVLGELILNKPLTNTSIQKIDLSVNDGIYIIKVVTNLSTTTKKIVIK